MVLTVVLARGLAHPRTQSVVCGVLILCLVVNPAIIPSERSSHPRQRVTPGLIRARSGPQLAADWAGSGGIVCLLAPVFQCSIIPICLCVCAHTGSVSQSSVSDCRNVPLTLYLCSS